MTERDDNAGTNVLAEAVAKDMEEAARQLLAKHSAMRSVIITADWYLPPSAAVQLPATVFRTQRGSFTANDLHGLIHQTQRSVMFLVSNLFRWFDAARKSSSEPALGLPPEAPRAPETPTGSGGPISPS